MTFIAKKSAKSIPITPVYTGAFDAWLKRQDKKTAGWVKSADFTGAEGSILLLPDGSGNLGRVIFGAGKGNGIYTFSSLPSRLPKNEAGYFIDQKMNKEDAGNAALGWALGSYYFGTYKKEKTKTFAALVWPATVDRQYVETTAEAIYLVRDLVNTPANDLGPEEIANAAENLTQAANAKIKVISGKDLLLENYPAIYEVGKASDRPPVLIDITWGNPKHPAVTLVGKGVVFDTGGLDIKPSSAMLLMKKDMGGAAHVLGLAHMIISAKLPVRLRVLIPSVENSISSNSYRPGDIIKTRKGISVEIGNTDAEGRLILCDALTEACSEKPKLVVDFATLTGAARVALGPDLPAMFSNNDKMAEALMASSKKTQDPMWQLPLWQPYYDMISSKTADINNAGAGGMAGAITAALYLQKFVEPDIPWIHIDTFAWNQGSKPGRPEGGEALGMRAVFDLIKTKFGRK